MGSMIGYGSLAFVGLVLLRRLAPKIALVTMVVLLILVIGWSRIYLRAHWASDVVGGYAIGLGVLIACIAIFYTKRKVPERLPSDVADVR
jgi:undecaprenyl-diphosphatase